MNTCDDWRLTIHFWPRATEAGVSPQTVTGFNPDPSPALYQPHEIEFSYPPTRADFLAVVMQMPWMTVWKDDLLPLIVRQPWPMIAPGYKAASADLTDNRGRVVGRLEVRRKTRYANLAYRVPMLTTYPGSDIDRFIARRVRGEARREQAREYVRANANVLLERLAATADEDGASAARVLGEVGRVLADAGFIRQPKATATA